MSREPRPALESRSLFSDPKILFVLGLSFTAGSITVGIGGGLLISVNIVASHPLSSMSQSNDHTVCDLRQARLVAELVIQGEDLGRCETNLAVCEQDLRVHQMFVSNLADAVEGSLQSNPLP